MAVFSSAISLKVVRNIIPASTTPKRPLCSFVDMFTWERTALRISASPSAISPVRRERSITSGVRSGNPPNWLARLSGLPELIAPGLVPAVRAASLKSSESRFFKGVASLTLIFCSRISGSVISAQRPTWEARIVRPFSSAARFQAGLPWASSWLRSTS
ncbi:hypothetical protein D3C81_1725010 [compost metagenome]